MILTKHAPVYERIFINSITLTIVSIGGFIKGMFGMVASGILILISPIWRIPRWIRGCL